MTWQQAKKSTRNKNFRKYERPGNLLHVSKRAQSHHNLLHIRIRERAQKLTSEFTTCFWQYSKSNINCSKSAYNLHNEGYIEKTQQTSRETSTEKWMSSGWLQVKKTIWNWTKWGATGNTHDELGQGETQGRYLALMISLSTSSTCPLCASCNDPKKWWRFRFIFEYCQKYNTINVSFRIDWQQWWFNSYSKRDVNQTFTTCNQALTQILANLEQ